MPKSDSLQGSLDLLVVDDPSRPPTTACTATPSWSAIQSVSGEVACESRKVSLYPAAASHGGGRLDSTPNWITKRQWACGAAHV